MIEMHKLSIERGMSWEESREKYDVMVKKHEGYYLSHQVCVYSLIPNFHKITIDIGVIQNKFSIVGS